MLITELIGWYWRRLCCASNAFNTVVCVCVVQSWDLVEQTQNYLKLLLHIINSDGRWKWCFGWRTEGLCLCSTGSDWVFHKRNGWFYQALLVPLHSGTFPPHTFPHMPWHILESLGQGTVQQITEIQHLWMPTVQNPGRWWWGKTFSGTGSVWQLLQPYSITVSEEYCGLVGGFSQN